MFLIFLNLIHTVRYPSIKMTMGKIKEDYLKVIDASYLLELTSPVISAIGFCWVSGCHLAFPCQ